MAVLTGMMYNDPVQTLVGGHEGQAGMIHGADANMLSTTPAIVPDEGTVFCWPKLISLFVTQPSQTHIQNRTIALNGVLQQGLGMWWRNMGDTFVPPQAPEIGGERTIPSTTTAGQLAGPPGGYGGGANIGGRIAGETVYDSRKLPALPGPNGAFVEILVTAHSSYPGHLAPEGTVVLLPMLY
jgi:hypothetical protein